MTVENCLKLLEAYKKQAENPTNESGLALTGEEGKNAREQSQKNYEDMKAHILKSRKFRDHPIIAELSKSEVKKDGKKSKG